ncbi:MAG: hypothetical protein Q3997_08490 [Propionibacteriaceae bacterium]|nr:hypothetical protein [Propionibacteriaceae bacterium]
MRWAKTGIVAMVAAMLVGCVQPAPPTPATERTQAPPWPAPRDGISYIEAAGMPKLPLNDTTDPHVFQLTITRNGVPVEVAAHIGTDRVRAWQAPVHTHDASGQVWLEGRGNRTVTLGQFFTVWGVRFDERCLGDVCGTVEVTVDGQRVNGVRDIVLRDVRQAMSVSVTG